jgi:hypothetical protein
MQSMVSWPASCEAKYSYNFEKMSKIYIECWCDHISHFLQICSIEAYWAWKKVFRVVPNWKMATILCTIRFEIQDVFMFQEKWVPIQFDRAKMSQGECQTKPEI